MDAALARAGGGGARTWRRRWRDFERDLNVALVRASMPAVPDRPLALPRGARRAGVGGLSRGAVAHAPTSPPDGRVRAEPLPAGVPVPPRARGRVPGHQPAAVATGRAADRVVGRRRRPRPRRPAPAVHLHRRRPQAVDLRLPRRGRAHARGARAATSRRCGPTASVRRSIARSFRAAPELLAFTNDLFSSIDTSVTRGRRVPVHGARPVPGGRAGAGPSGRLRLVAAGDTPGGRRRRSPPRWRACSPTASCAIARPACRGRPARATSRSSSGRARAIARSRRRSRRAGFRPTSTRASASSTPTR